MKRTIKRFAAGALVFTALFSLTSCMDILQILLEESGSSSSSYNVVTATETKTDTYSSSNNIFEVDPYTKTLTVSGLTSGKSIYYARVNKGSKTVSTNHQRAVVTGSSSGVRSVAAQTMNEVEIGELPESFPKHFKAPDISLDDVKSSAVSRVVSSSGLETKTQINRTVGTTKSVYVDTNVDINQFALKSATLKAAGTYCNVWVVDGYYTDGTASGAKVNTSRCNELKNQFDALYPLVRNVFGEESDNIIYTYSNAGTLKAASSNYPMSSYSDTGTIINIVVYDIGNDYSSKTKCGVLGYFYSKDYYSQTSSVNTDIRYSNQGKYFYIDSEYAVSSLNTIVSTLAHEFQHMINFNQKNIENGVKPDTSYNEMLSMLCEDMMADYLGLSSSKSVISARIPGFNTSYFLSGIREYRDDKYAALSYSTSYAFGSWLARQYGGAALVKKMSQNEYVNNSSIVSAVNSSVNSKSYTFDQLFQQFLAACLNKGASSGYTHNQAAGTKLTYSSYSYPMPAINLWDTAYKYPTDNNPFLVTNQSDCAATKADSYTGPFVIANNYAFALHPEYGVTLHKAGTTSDSTLSLTFSSSGADCVYIYVIIQ